MRAHTPHPQPLPSQGEGGSYAQVYPQLNFENLTRYIILSEERSESIEAEATRRAQSYLRNKYKKQKKKNTDFFTSPPRASATKPERRYPQLRRPGGFFFFNFSL